VAYTRQQLAACAADLASRFLTQLQGQGLVADFVDTYVAEYDRRVLQAHPQSYRELLATLGREALLVMAAQVSAELPRYLTRRRPPVLRGPENWAADDFRNDLAAALGRILRWTAEDVEEFRRDAALYTQLTARTARVKKRREARDPAEGPFVDRCALLLDPSMLEQGRRAAGKFLAELEHVAEQSLASVFPGSG